MIFAKSQIDYALGQGPRINGQPGSQVVGVGNNYPTHPHHGSSSCPKKEFREFVLLYGMNMI